MSREYASQRAKKILERNDWIDQKMAGKISSSELPVKHLSDRTERLQAYFWESVYTACTHQECLIALRAALQAAGYFSEIQNLGTISTADMRDSYLDARNRVEDLMAEGARAIRNLASLVVES